MQETEPNKSDDDALAGESLNDGAENDRAENEAINRALEQGIGAAEVDQLRAEAEQAADRTLRLQAEMENLRSRTAREIAETRRYAAAPLMRDLLPVVDNMSRAMEVAEDAQTVEGLLEGFRMVKRQLLDTLAQHHCTEIAALGEPFDPNIHEAIQQLPSEEVPAESVCLVAQSGYQLYDRVIRPSQVIVSTGPSDPDATETDES